MTWRGHPSPGFPLLLSLPPQKDNSICSEQDRVLFLCIILLSDISRTITEVTGRKWS